MNQIYTRIDSLQSLFHGFSPVFRKISLKFFSFFLEISVFYWKLFLKKWATPTRSCSLSQLFLYPNNAKRRVPFCAISYGIKNLVKKQNLFQKANSETEKCDVLIGEIIIWFEHIAQNCSAETNNKRRQIFKVCRRLLFDYSRYTINSVFPFSFI